MAAEPNDLDAIEFPEVTPPTLSGARGRRCGRHEWERVPITATGTNRVIDVRHLCRRCGAIRDPERARRGKSASRQGKDAEREIARDTGGRRVGQYGGEVDVLAPTPRRFAIQSKRVTAPTAARGEAARRATFPEWIWDELRKLPVTGGDVPALIVSDKPGSGGDRRALVVVDYRDFRDLYGEPLGVAE